MTVGEKDARPQVLLVEDDPVIAQMYVERLEVEKLHVKVIGNGREAFDWLQALKVWPQVLILDIMLPGMSGFEILEQLKGDARLPKMSVIIVTAYADAERHEAANELGFGEYYVKTQIKPSEIAELVKKRIKG